MFWAATPPRFMKDMVVGPPVKKPGSPEVLSPERGMVAFPVALSGANGVERIEVDAFPMPGMPRRDTEPPEMLRAVKSTLTLKLRPLVSAMPGMIWLVLQEPPLQTTLPIPLYDPVIPDCALRN